MGEKKDFAHYKQGMYLATPLGHGIVFHKLIQYV